MLIFNQYFAYSCFFMGLGCTSPNTNSPQVKADKEFSLSPGQGLTINGMSFYLLDIKDSRCPADAGCQNSGNVTITLKISKDNKPLKGSVFSLSLQKSEYLTEDYDIQFTHVEPVRGKQSREISKSKYKVTLKLKNTAPSFQIVEIKNPSGIIFPKDGPNYRPGFKEAEGSWSPLEVDVRKADEMVQKYISDPQQTARNIVASYPKGNQINAQKYLSDRICKISKIYPKYRRQYVGFLSRENKHKLIWVNFFIPDDFLERTWKKDICVVNDGGYYFFNVLIDLETGKCLSFQINGDA